MDSRKEFCAIVHVLRTGIQWKALPGEFSSAGSIYAYFLKWLGDVFFLRLWRMGLAEYDEMKVIARSWQSIDVSRGKAPLIVEAVGPNPTDREKTRNEAAPPGRWEWSPHVYSRDRSQQA